MPPDAAWGTLQTDRLILRPRRPSEAATYRQLWTERDPRVPSHRRIDADGRPTVADIASQFRTAHDDTMPGLLAVERKSGGDVIGYCGLIVQGAGVGDEPELVYELLRGIHGHGYATEAARAIVTWADRASYRRISASVWDWNVASRRVLEKLGFREVGRVNSSSGVTLLTVREARTSPVPRSTVTPAPHAASATPPPTAPPSPAPVAPLPPAPWVAPAPPTPLSPK